MKGLLTAALLAGAFCSAPALAGSITINGDTTGSPTFNRPIANGVDAPVFLSAVGTDVPYDVVGFSVSSSGTYDFESLANFDNYLGLYSGSFNPADSLTNALIYNDDGVSGIGSSDFSYALTSGSHYFAVVTGFENTDFGSYSLSIAGPGDITLAGTVPEPASWALMITGFGMVGAAARRRHAVTSVSA